MLCLQALLVQSTMEAARQQHQLQPDSAPQSSGRSSDGQPEISELRAEYEARLAAAAEHAEQVKHFCLCLRQQHCPHAQCLLVMIFTAWKHQTMQTTAAFVHRGKGVSNVWPTCRSA